MDFSPRAMVEGKKNERISFACSDELSNIAKFLSEKKKLSISEYAHRALVEKIQKDVDEIFSLEPHLDRPLRELFQKFFWLSNLPW